MVLNVAEGMASGHLTESSDTASSPKLTIAFIGAKSVGKTSIIRVSHYSIFLHNAQSLSHSAIDSASVYLYFVTGQCIQRNRHFKFGTGHIFHNKWIPRLNCRSILFISTCWLNNRTKEPTSRRWRLSRA